MTSNIKLIRITETNKLPMNSVAWGAIPSYIIESVKVNVRNGQVRSAAVINVQDISGRATVLFEGKLVATLLGFGAKEWKHVEDMTSTCELFYRHFAKGISPSLPLEQRVFYTHCQYHVKRETIVIKFQRVPNIRKGEKDVPFLKVLQCTLPNAEVMKRYEF